MKEAHKAKMILATELTRHAREKIAKRFCLHEKDQQDRLAIKAFRDGRIEGEAKKGGMIIDYLGIHFIFSASNGHPVLITCYTPNQMSKR